MKLTKEIVKTLPVTDGDKTLLNTSLDELETLNAMTGKDFYIDRQDYHDEYSPERTDPCPDYYGQFRVMESSYDFKMGEEYSNATELSNGVTMLLDAFTTMGFDCYCGVNKGWYKLIREASLEVEKYNFEHPDEPHVSIIDVKRKGGGLRISLNRYPYWIDTKIERIEDKSFKICEKCGKETTPKEHHGWIYTYCDDCMKETFKEERKN